MSIVPFHPFRPSSEAWKPMDRSPLDFTRRVLPLLALLGALFVAGPTAAQGPDRPAVVKERVIAPPVMASILHGRDLRDSNNVQALRRPARMDLHEVELLDALTEFMTSSGVPLLFSPTLVPSMRVSCPCVDLPAGEALGVLLEGTGLTFREQGPQVVILRDPRMVLPVSSPASVPRVAPASGARLTMPVAPPLVAVRTTARQGVVVGRVIDRGSQRPLAGAQVRVVGTGLGSLTDATGTFQLSGVSAGEVEIRVEFLGYAAGVRTVQVRAGETVRADFALAERAISLDALVVTATGQVRGREVATSLSRITTREIEAAAPRHAQDLITGRAPGVTVLQNSGQPGAGGTIVLRGNNSISQGNDPIIYLDGVRIHGGAISANMTTSQRSSALNDINPADIERVEIVKGAAATTLYGTEASAGVIQIFTKRGMEGAARWTAELGTGVNSLGHVGPKANNPAGLFVTRCSGPDLVDYLGRAFEDPTCPERGSWTRNGMVQRYSLSVSGGVERFGYYLSANFSDEEGALAAGGTAAGGFRGNFTVRPTERLELSFTPSYATRSTRWIPEGQGNDAFLVNVTRGARSNYRGGEGCLNPDAVCVVNAENLRSDNTTQSDKFVAGLSVTHSTNDWLRNRVTVGWDYNAVQDQMLLPFGHFRQPLGLLETGDLLRTQLSLEYVGTADATLGGKWTSSFAWGGQAFVDRIRTISTAAQDFAGPGMPTLVDAARREVLGNEDQRVINAGFFVQESLAWQDLLFLTLGLRVDGNSAFGRDFGLQSYPKLGVSYVVSDHTERLPVWWETLKLRAAVGESGKAPGAFDAMRTWAAVAGDDGRPGFTPNQIGNANLGPERSREVEGGAEASFFDGLLDLDFTWFRQDTREALVPVVFAPSEGFTSTQLQNVGHLRNEGTELRLSLRLLSSDRVDWRVRVDHSTVRSEAVDLGGEEVLVDNSARTVIREGYPVPAYVGNLIRNPDEFADPVIERNAYIGSPYPDRTISVSSSLGLGQRLSLEALGEFQMGGHLLNNIAYQNARLGVWPGCYEVQQKEQRMRDGDANAFNDVPARDRARCALNSSAISHFRESWIEPSDFFRLRNVSATWQLPAGVVPGAASASLQVAARNLLTITDFSGTDPELDDNPTSLSRRDYYNVPTYRSFLVNLRVHF